MSRVLHAGQRRLDLSAPAVMGIVNVTPDSFHEGSRRQNVADAVAAALQMVDEGARLIDVGGESTRPGASPVSLQLELDRVIPVIEQLRSRTDAVISIDTMKAAVMRAACAAGADLINDVAALTDDGALEIAAASGSAVCLVHMQGCPATMQLAPGYGDVVAEVSGFLDDRIADCEAAGIARDRLLIDPGFGFGKRHSDNLDLLRRLNVFARSGVPVLVGGSRKGMIGQMTGRAVADRMPGGLAFAILACQRGAAIVRTHDVAATVDVLNVLRAIEPPESAALPDETATP